MDMVVTVKVAMAGTASTGCGLGRAGAEAGSRIVTHGATKAGMHLGRGGADER